MKILTIILLMASGYFFYFKTEEGKRNWTGVALAAAAIGIYLFDWLILGN
ncbi:MAG: hypothetical protein SFY92_00765 [Verrucomicrobiae bacterium]|nr:hypothetical protein [Verrucomicrobiae bacterium]